MEPPVQVLNASSTSRSGTSAGTQGSAEATTNTVSAQNSPSMVEPKQMTDPRVSRCMEVGRRSGPKTCLQLL
jgi:hypothetical protein